MSLWKKNDPSKNAVRAVPFKPTEGLNTNRSCATGEWNFRRDLSNASVPVEPLFLWDTAVQRQDYSTDASHRTIQVKENVANILPQQGEKF